MNYISFVVERRSPYIFFNVLGAPLGININKVKDGPLSSASIYNV